MRRGCTGMCRVSQVYVVMYEWGCVGMRRDSWGYVGMYRAMWGYVGMCR